MEPSLLSCDQAVKTPHRAVSISSSFCLFTISFGLLTDPPSQR